MPLPTAGDVHVNRPLTNISVAFMQNPTNFVADRIFPIVPVSKQSDLYFTYPKDFWNRDGLKLRAPATRAEAIGYGVTTASYHCRKWAAMRPIDDDMRANADQPLNPDRESTEFLSQMALIRKEKLFVGSYLTGGLWDQDLAGVATTPSTDEVLHWDDASSTPIEDVEAQQTEILLNTGFMPNVLALGFQVFQKLRNHADLIARVNSGQTPGAPATVNEQRMAEIFNVDQVVVMKAIEATALEGAATQTHAFISGKTALLAYAAPSPGLLMPSAGYTFAWTGLLGAGSGGQRIKSYRDEPISSDVIEIELAVDVNLVSASLGAFWDTVVS